jgi:hypothetical protein
MLRNKHLILVESLRLSKVAFSVLHVFNSHSARENAEGVVSRGTGACARLTVCVVSDTLIFIVVKLKEDSLWLMLHSKVRKFN